jgi:proteic killer suppression protein
MIHSFACPETELIFKQTRSKKLPPNIQAVALRKLLMIDAAADLRFLKNPPGNHLHALDRDRLGQHAIKINDQWRICFRFSPPNAYDVEIVDYH